MEFLYILSRVRMDEKYANFYITEEALATQ